MTPIGIAGPHQRRMISAQNGAGQSQVLVWFARITLALLIFKISKAGYYISDAYAYYIEHGYMQTDDIIEDGGQLSFIGTLGTVAMIGLIVSGFISGLGSRFFSRMKVVVFVHLYIFVSSFWSNVPGPTLFELIKSGIHIIALFFALDILGGRRALDILLWIVGAIALASLALGLQDPAFRISLGADGWRGLFAHKNWLAAFCMFSIAAILPSAFLGRLRLLEAAVLGLLATLLVLSQGKTALALTLFYAATLVIGVFINDNSRKIMISAISVLIGPLILLIAIALPIIAETEIFSFSGRSGLWKYFYSQLSDNFIFGFGGYTLKTDLEFAINAMKAINAPSPDSSVVVMTVNYGVFYPFLQVAFLWPFISALRGRNDLFSLGLGAALVVLIGYGCMESDSGLSANLSFFSMAILAAQIPAAGFASQSRAPDRLHRRRYRRVTQGFAGSPDAGLPTGTINSGIRNLRSFGQET